MLTNLKLKNAILIQVLNILVFKIKSDIIWGFRVSIVVKVVFTYIGAHYLTLLYNLGQSVMVSCWAQSRSSSVCFLIASVPPHCLNICTLYSHFWETSWRACIARGKKNIKKIGKKNIKKLEIFSLRHPPATGEFQQKI